METLEKKVIDTVKDLEKSMAADKKYLELEKANQDFKKMVAKGLIKERGNNLLSPAEITSKIRGFFNVKRTDMVNDTVKDFEKSMAADKKYLELEKANQDFKKMVAKGLIKERGNNLLSSSEITDKNRGSFNVKQTDADQMI